MSFNINNMNFQCAPMYNQNKSNQLMGYLCSSKSRNVEGFEDVTSWGGFHKPSYNGDSNWQNHQIDSNKFWYLCDYSASLISYSQNESKNSLTWRWTNSDQSNKILEYLKTNQSTFDNRTGPRYSGNTCVFIFALYGPDDKEYFLTNPAVQLSGDNITLVSDRNDSVSMGMADSVFSTAKNLTIGGWQIRVGAIDVDDHSMRQLNN